MDFKPFSPVDIRFCTLAGFEEQISALEDERVLVLADEGTFGRLKEACPAFGRLINDSKNRLVTDIRPNPSVDDVLCQINMLRREERYGTILAVGGGSCIDLAKAISALAGLADGRDATYEEITEAIRSKSFFKGCGPADIIAVPTTAGTGAEMTKWATVWDLRNGKKLSLEDNGCFSKAAIIVPELTESMPPRLTLSTGLDALSHAMEAFWAKARTPLSQALALGSIGRIKKFLPQALKNGSDTGVRKEMCTASLLAGLAFSITKTTACHSISYPLTLGYRVPHGFAAALTLSQVMAINKEAVPEAEEITALFGGAGGFDEWLSGVTEGIQSLRLSAFGITGDMTGAIAEGAFTLGRMDNNPAALTKETVEQILKNIL